MNFAYIRKKPEELVSGCVGQPLPLRPACIAKLFKFSCFGAGCAWLKFRAPPCHIPNPSGCLCIK